MKNIYLLFLLTTLLFTSCNIYQDITFKEDCSISYNMTVDMTELIRISPDGMEQIKKQEIGVDTVYSLAEFYKEKVEEENRELSNEELSVLENMKNFYVKTTTGEAKDEFKISLFGDFLNADDLNKALTATRRLSALEKDNKRSKKEDGEEEEYVENEEPKKKKENMFGDLIKSTIYSYKWDGKVMQSTITREGNNEESDSESGVTSMMASMFTGGKAKITYHFPQKIKDVNNEDATFSKDGKSVILNYSFTELLYITNQNIIIETE